MRITIIGTGPGDLSLISPYATNLIQRAAVVFSSERLFDLFRHLNKNTRCAAMGNIEHLVKEQAAGFAASIEEGQVDPVSTDDRLIAVLVSGDGGLFQPVFNFAGTVVRFRIPGRVGEWLQQPAVFRGPAATAL